MLFFDSQAGISLIEVLMSTGILTATVMIISTSIANVYKLSAMDTNLPFIIDTEPMIRYEIKSTLDNFQRLILSMGNTTATNAQQCTNVTQQLTDSQNQYTLMRPIAFGDMNEIRTNINKYLMPNDIAAKIPLDSIDNAIETFSKLKERKNVSSDEQSLKEAFNRCRREQTTKPGNDNIRSMNSFYICGYAENLLVEVTGVWWDFNRDRPLNCNQMNEQTGRGIRVQFKGYTYNEQNNGGFEVLAKTGNMMFRKEVKKESEADGELQ